jgi:hypothetical protein
VRSHGRDEILGTAYSDHDLVVFLQNAGVDDLEGVLDDPGRGGGMARRPRPRVHHCLTALGPPVAPAVGPV